MEADDSPNINAVSGASGITDVYMDWRGVQYRFELTPRFKKLVPWLAIEGLVKDVARYAIDEMLVSGVLVKATVIEDGYLDGEQPESNLVWYRLDVE